MTAGYAGAVKQAGRIFARQPAAWLPALGLGAPLLLGWVWLALSLLGRLGREGWEGLARPAVWGGALVLAVALLLLARVYQLGYRQMLNGLLCRDRVVWPEVWACLRRRGPGWCGSGLVFRLCSLGLQLAGFVVVLLLLTGNDLGRLGAGFPPLSRLPGLWRSVGWWPLLGLLALLAGIGAAESMLRQAALFQATVVVTDEVGAWTAARRSLGYLYGRGGRLFGRSFGRCCLLLGALLLPLVLTEPARLAILRLADTDLAAARFQTALCLTIWLVATALAWALVRDWLTLADLVLYRQRGGADGDPALLVRGVRPPRRRRPAAPGWQVASEPSVLAVPIFPVASEAVSDDPTTDLPTL